VLEPVMNCSTRRRSIRGFTLIELIIAVAIAAILLTLAAPSFRGFLAKKRLEGVATELSTDLQYARSVAVARNTTVRLTFISATCYAIHEVALAVDTATWCSAPPANSALLKSVQLQAGSSATLSGAPAYVEFDPVRGTAVTDTANADASIDVVSSMGSWQMRNTVTLLGKVNLCSPSASVRGFPSC
jgi:type IV fimbrial biogenesis protein FimT